jgi:glycosyltransferase involved in cell wall biosynthesis
VAQLPHLRIAVVSTWPPKVCGIARFSRDLCTALVDLDPHRVSVDYKVLALTDPGDQLTFGKEVRVVIPQEDLAAIERAAAWINASGANVVSLQHEFGIWGGFDGAFVLPFLDHLHIPVLTTFHTVPFSDHAFDREGRLHLLGEIIKRSGHLVTFLPQARDFLLAHYALDPARVTMQWHGAPSYPLHDRDEAKQALGLSGRLVISTMGLLNRFKGIDVALEAVQTLAGEYPDLLYLILGQPHPAEPEGFYPALRSAVQRLGIGGQVRFVDHFLSEQEIEQYLAATDIYVTPYRDMSQISSGTLTRALAAGRLAVSTPYPYATEALRNGVGVLTPVSDPAALAETLRPLVADAHLREQYDQRAREFAAVLRWDRVATEYAALAAALVEG